MLRSRIPMATLALVASVLLSGCPYRPIVPPSAYPAIPRGGHGGWSGGPQPDIDPTPLGGTGRPPIVQPPSALSGNPWKPDVAARNWKSIVIHHTATNRGSVESIHATHVKRKDAQGQPWLGIGYHFVIGNGNGMQDGEIESTFRWRTQIHGAHAGNREHNQHGIGIALIGNFERQPPTAAQLIAVKQLVAVLKREYAIPAAKVVGHGDIRATACPGKLFPMKDVAASESGIQFGGLPAGRNAFAVRGATR